MGSRFPAPVQNEPGVYPASSKMGTRSLFRGKAAMPWCQPPTPSSTEVKQIVELYHYTNSGPSWPVLGELYLETPGKRVSRHSSHFTELEGSLPCSQQLPVFHILKHTHTNSTQTLLILFLSKHLSTVFASKPSSSIGHFRYGFPIKALDAFLFSPPGSSFIPYSVQRQVQSLL